MPIRGTSLFSVVVGSRVEWSARCAGDRKHTQAQGLGISPRLMWYLSARVCRRRLYTDRNLINKLLAHFLASAFVSSTNWTIFNWIAFSVVYRWHCTCTGRAGAYPAICVIVIQDTRHPPKGRLIRTQDQNSTKQWLNCCGDNRITDCADGIDWWIAIDDDCCVCRCNAIIVLCLTTKREPLFQSHRITRAMICVQTTIARFRMAGGEDVEKRLTADTTYIGLGVWLRLLLLGMRWGQFGKRSPRTLTFLFWNVLW